MSVETTAVITDAEAPIVGHVGGQGDRSRVTAYLEVDDFRILLGRSLSNDAKRAFLRRLADQCRNLASAIPADTPAAPSPATVFGGAR